MEQRSLNSREKALEAKRKYYLKNRDTILQKQRQQLEAQQIYRLKNKEKIREAKREYYLKNRDTILQKQKQFYLNNCTPSKLYVFHLNTFIII